VYLCIAVVIPLLTIAVTLALCLLVIAVACAVRYARKHCCCLAPRAGSYTPSPSSYGNRASESATVNQRHARGVHRLRERATTKPTRAAQLAETEPAYRSIVIIGSDRVARRAVPTNDPPRPRWIVRHGSTWGNLSQVTNETLPLPPPPPPPPLPAVLGGDRREDADDVGRRTVPSIVNLLEGRVNVAAQIHDSQPKLQDTK